jgi:hypothetical protein
MALFQTCATLSRGTRSAIINPIADPSEYQEKFWTKSFNNYMLILPGKNSFKACGAAYKYTEFSISGAYLIT